MVRRWGITRLRDGLPGSLLSASYVAYGLRIAANLPLPGFSVRSDAGAIDVWIWLKEKSASPSTFSVSPPQFFYTSPGRNAHGQPLLRVAKLAGGAYFGLFYADGARFAVERTGREVWADWPENYTLEDACTYLAGPVLGLLLRLRGVTCLHASAIAVGDRAIALVGSPGAGKSTTATAFAHCGYAVLSDDVVALTDRRDHFLVQPGYPRLNLWPDSVRALFGSEDALPRITPTWDKRFLALDQPGFRFESRPLPLAAVYVLDPRQSAEFACSIETIPASPAMMTLVANTYVNYLLDREMRRQEFDVLSRLVSAVPVRSVQPPNDPSRLRDLCEAIASDAGDLHAMRPTSAVPVTS